MGSKDQCEKILTEKLSSLENSEEASVEEKTDEATAIKHSKKSKKEIQELKNEIVTKEEAIKVFKNKLKDLQTIIEEKEIKINSQNQLICDLKEKIDLLSNTFGKFPNWYSISIKLLNISFYFRH